MAKAGTARQLSVVSDGDGWMQPLAKGDIDHEEGTSFGYMERLFYAFDDGAVLDYGNWEAIDLRTMMEADYKARQIFNAITLPIISAKKHIEPAKGDSGEAEFVSKVFSFDADAADVLNGAACKTPLDTVVAQMTSAVAYRRSFHEKVWTKGSGDLAGNHIYDKIAYRPQTTCRIMRHPRSGEIIGFEQDAYLTGSGVALKRGMDRPRIKSNRAVIHIHGSSLDPINGTSVMEIPYWAYKTKQKLLFLWFQYLEGVALPRSAVISNDETTSRRVAGALRKTKNSGVVPVWTTDVANFKIDTLDLSGAQGAAEFMKAISFLDQCSTQEVLAGFLDLTGTDKVGGSYALSSDGSDFFLQSDEARNRELESTVRSQIFAPLIRYNMGPSARVPHYRIDPLTAENKQAAIDMLTKLLGSRSATEVPLEFIGEMAASVSDSFGLDGDKVRASFEKAAVDAKALAAQQSKQMASPPGQQVAAINGVVSQATQIAKKATRPKGAKV